MRDLRLLAAAVGASALGDLLAMVVLALRVHDETGSGIAVAAYFAATLVPPVLLAPVAGLVADRVESVRVLVVASLAQAALAAALALSGGLPATLALAALLAAGAAFSGPAEFALVPAVARPDGLASANGLIESARYAGFTAGPVVAAVVLAAAGPEAALLVNAASFLVVAVAGALLRARRPPVTERVRGDGALAGATALRADGPLRILVGATTVALLFISSSLTVEVFYVRDVLHAGETGYALLMAGWTVGMVLGASGLAHRVPARVRVPAALVALGIQGAGMGFQTVWVVFPAALGGYVVGGVGHGVKNALVRTAIQDRVPGALHGRAFAAYGAMRNSAELGAVSAGGLLVGAIGAQAALAIAGLGPMLAAAAGLLALNAAGRRGGGRSRGRLRARAAPIPRATAVESGAPAR